jgi:hypothetical protein
MATAPTVMAGLDRVMAAAHSGTAAAHSVMAGPDPAISRPRHERACW